jgi:hypothetical protein
LVHTFIGVAYGLLALSSVGVLGLAVAWELLENPLKVRVPALFPHATRDTLRNSFGDVLAVMFGWGVARWLCAR